MVKISLSIVNLQEGEPVPYDYVNFWNIEARKERVVQRKRTVTLESWRNREIWRRLKKKL